MRGYVKNISDLVKVWYGGPEFNPIRSMLLQKADSNVLTTTSGVYNAVYGAMAWVQFNRDANLFAALPKFVHDQDGWRLIRARAASTPAGGVGEDGAIPDTTLPTVVEVSTKPKLVSHAFSVSLLQQIAAKNRNDAWGKMDDVRQYFVGEHKEHVNDMLAQDYDTLASNNIESLDRVCASAAETSALSYTAGDEDMYGIDRSGNTIYDAQILHASGTDRALTDTLLRTLVANTNNAGANVEQGTGAGRWWAMAHNTYASVLGLFETAVRYNYIQDNVNVKVGVNGVSSPNGIGVGINVSTLYSYPVIISKNVEQDTIGRVYLFDTSDADGYGIPRMGFSTALPTTYFESGLAQNNPFAINRFGDEGVYLTVGELVCRFFAAQGKIRDLL